MYVNRSSGTLLYQLSSGQKAAMTLSVHSCLQNDTGCHLLFCFVQCNSTSMTVQSWVIRGNFATLLVRVSACLVMNPRPFVEVLKQTPGHTNQISAALEHKPISPHHKPLILFLQLAGPPPRLCVSCCSSL